MLRTVSLVCLCWGALGIFPSGWADDRPAADASLLPGTQPLTLEEPLDVVMVRGINRYAERQLVQATEKRTAPWLAHPVSSQQGRADRQAARAQLKQIIGLPELNAGPAALAYSKTDYAHPDQTVPGAELVNCAVSTCQWNAFAGVTGCGLVAIPRKLPANKKSPVLLMVVIPDAVQTPEASFGLQPSETDSIPLARELADRGLVVLAPSLIDRDFANSGHPRIRWTNVPHREFLYRTSFEMGLHPVGYEVAKIVTGIQAVRHELAGRPVRTVVVGTGEGGLIALMAAALFPEEIDAAMVRGYFQNRDHIYEEPIYRNLFGQLKEFGDAEIASLIAPRPLIIDPCDVTEVAGPVPTMDRSNVAAPGKISTPELASVQKEFERASRYFQQAGAIQKVSSSEESAAKQERTDDQKNTDRPGTEGPEKLEFAVLEFAVLANRMEADHAELIIQAEKLAADVDDVYRDKNVVAKWCSLAIDTATGEPKAQATDNDVQRTIQRGGKETTQLLVIVDPDPKRRITGKLLKEARKFPSENRFVIGIKFDHRGGELMQQLTTRYSPRSGDRNRLVVLLKGQIHSAPFINFVIGSSAVIEGSFTEAEMDELIGVLKTEQQHPSAVPALTIVPHTATAEQPEATRQALRTLIETHFPDVELQASKSNTPVDQVGPTPEFLKQRMKSQVEELVWYSQRAMHSSQALRNILWKTVPTKNIEQTVEALKPFRKMVHETFIGRLPAASLPPRPRSRRILEDAAYTGYEVVLDVHPGAQPQNGAELKADDPGIIAGGILLLPADLKPEEKRPVVVFQHGLEGTPMDTITTDQTQRAWRAYQAASVALVRQGYIVYAPQNPYRGHDEFRAIQRKSNPLGKSLFSYIIEQHQVTLDWLASLSYVDPSRIAFYGISYGGKTAVRVPPLLVGDEKHAGYCLSICSADFNEWILKNASTEQRSSYVFTGEYEIYEWNMAHVANYAELTWLMIPRPFMVERGLDDGVAPDDWVGAEYARARRPYFKLGIDDKIFIGIFDGPHMIHGTEAYAFLGKHLNWPARSAP